MHPQSFGPSLKLFLPELLAIWSSFVLFPYNIIRPAYPKFFRLFNRAIDYDISRQNQMQEILDTALSRGGFNQLQIHGYNSRTFERNILTDKCLNAIRDKAAILVWNYLLKGISFSKVTFTMIGRLSEHILKCNPMLLKALRHTYSYVFLDEFQDTTKIQYDLTCTCFNELEQLLKLVKFAKEDVLISVGDMLDRGPKSWKVCGFFKETPNAYSVLGNHERRVAGTIRGTSLPAWSQKHSLSMLNPEEQLIWAEYLENLPAVIETEHAIITHAQLDPDKSLLQQDAYFTCAVGGSKVHIPLDENGVPLWFYKTDFKKAVCIGHVGYPKVELVTDKLFALDTGVVRGGELTRVVFPGGKLFSIESKQDYYTESFNEWHLRIEKAEKDPYEWPFKKVIDLLAIGRNNDSSKITKQVVEARLAVDELRIDKWSQIVQKELSKHFGNVPELGPGRGEYFKKVSEGFTDHQMGALAAKVVAGKIRGIEDFIPFVKKATLTRLRHTMDELLNIVKNPGRLFVP